MEVSQAKDDLIFLLLKIGKRFGEKNIIKILPALNELHITVNPNLNVSLK
jgi:hypothetical protein